MSRSSLYLSLTLLSVFGLSSCSTMIDNAMQDVAIETPGALDAQCIINLDEMRYSVRPPQTVTIRKTKGPMRVSCTAPGNRRKEVTVEASIPESAMLNVGNAILPGLVFDKHTGALYEYPSTVIIDFQAIPYQPDSMPQYHNPDIAPPQDQPLEYMGPSNPDLPSDSEKKIRQNLEELEMQMPASQYEAPLK